MSKVRPVRLVPGLRVDRVDGELVVLDEARLRVHRLHGPAADVVRRLEDGADLALGDEATLRVVGALRSAGVVRGGIPRRRALGVAAAAASLGVLTMALPSASVSASTVQGGGGSALELTGGGTAGAPSGSYAGLGPFGNNMFPADDVSYVTFTSNGSLTVSGDQSLAVSILMVGGGGGGGGGEYDDEAEDWMYGGGGGGGPVAVVTTTLAAGESYDVTVGSYGEGGSPYSGFQGAGTDGYASGFEGFSLMSKGGYGGGGGQGINTGGKTVGVADGEGVLGCSGGAGGARGSDQAAGGGAGAGGDGQDGNSGSSTGGDGGSGHTVSGFFAAPVVLGAGGQGGGSTYGTSPAGWGVYGSGGGGRDSFGQDGVQGVVVVRYPPVGP